MHMEAKMFAKMFFILKETCRFVAKEKAYFLLPILFLFALLGVLIISAGPSAITAFIYAGF